MWYRIPCSCCGSPVVLSYGYVISVFCKKCHSGSTAESHVHASLKKFLAHYYDENTRFTIVITLDERAA